MVYIDDILVLGSIVGEHVENLRLVLHRLHQVGLRLRPTKCHFMQTQVEYLGYFVSETGISTDPAKVEAVKAFPTPQDLKA